MEFIFETTYDQKALTAMAKGLRKSVRRKRSRRSHILGWLVIALAVFLVVRSRALNFRAVITLLAAAIVLLALLFEDHLNGFFAKKRMLPGTGKAISHFTNDFYSSETEIGKTEFHYEYITALAESEDYFIFLFGNNHAQVYDKRTLSGGSIDAFRSFIQEKTQKTVFRI